MRREITSAMNSGDIIVLTVAALRVALDRAVPSTFSVTRRGDVVCDPGLLAMHKSPLASLTPRASRLLVAAKVLIELAPDEVCSVLLSEARTAVSQLPAHHTLKLAGRGKTARTQSPGDDDDDDHYTGRHVSEEEFMAKMADIMLAENDAMEVEAAVAVTEPTPLRDIPESARQWRIPEPATIAVAAEAATASQPRISEIEDIPGLPNEIAAVIVQNIPALERLRLRCTSKLWEAKMLGTVRVLTQEILDRTLPAELGRLTGVEEIVIADDQARTMTKLQALFEKFDENHIVHGLRHLELGGDNAVNASPVLPYLHMLTDLEVLSITGGTYVDQGTASVLGKIGLFLPKLTALHLPVIAHPAVKNPWRVKSLSFLLTDAAPPDYLTGMTQLEELFVHVSEDTRLDVLPDVPRQVNALVLFRAPPDALEDIQLSRTVPRLQHLVVHTPQSDESVREVGRLTSLTNLLIRLDDRHSMHLAALTDLKMLLVTLDVTQRTVPSDYGMSLLASLPQLDLAVRHVVARPSKYSYTSRSGGDVVKMDVNHATINPTLPVQGRFLVQMTLGRCILETNRYSWSFPRTLQKLTIEKCKLDEDSHPLLLPPNLEILILHERVVRAPRTRAATIIRVLVKGAISGLDRLRYFKYDTSLRSPTTRPRQAIKYYEEREGDLAGIETVLLGPNDERWA